MTVTGKFAAVNVMSLVLLAGVAGANCLEKATLSDYDYVGLSICEAVLRLFQTMSSSIWPGYNLAERPFIVYIPDRWALLFNGTPDAEGFSPYPKAWPNLGVNVLYHRGQLKDLVGQLAFDFEAGGQKLVAVGFPEKLPEEFDLSHPNIYLFGYVVHEAFHQYQNEKFGDIPWEREEKYPILDPENTALAYLEMRLLMDALRAAYAGDQKVVGDRLGQFVAVRKKRWARGDHFVERYEQGQEIREGTARYVELKSVELLKNLKYKSSLRGRTNPLEADLRSVSMPDLLLEDFKGRITRDSVAPGDMLRNRIYPVGAALGFLADYLNIDWKATAQEAGTTFQFGELFADKLGLEEGRTKDYLERAESEYGLGRMLLSAEALIKEYRAGYEAELEAFEAQKGLRVEMGFVYKSLSRSRSSRAKKWVINQGSVSLNSHYDVYALKNDHLNLQLQGVGVLEKDDWSAKKKSVIFYVPRLTAVAVDQKPLDLGRGIHARFSSLKIQEDNFRFESSQPGELSYDGRRLVITLE
jgi:hypothetical protein